MSGAIAKSGAPLPVISVRVVEKGVTAAGSHILCVIDQNLRFCTESLESYFFTGWKPVVYDALVIAAAVEYSDRIQRRRAFIWGREIDLSVPVHEPDLWNRKEISATLHEALNFLTGDQWHIAFRGRRRPLNPIRQGMFPLEPGKSAVIPFSDGMDSRAVAGLMARELGDKLVRIRLGKTRIRPTAPFAAVPYEVRGGGRRFVESSARSRGFKFALIAGIAAYFADVDEIIVPESGQGALGPALIPVGQAYGDYRSHPLFTNLMERFLEALLGKRMSFRFPQLWKTKGETLAAFVREQKGAVWSDTRSCWQQSRQVSVEHKRRQCGICAACMLRRLSVHAAGLKEPRETYVWEDLRAPSFEAGAAASFEKKKITGAMREYAIAGTLHLDHLAALVHSPANAAALALGASQLSQACRLPLSEARVRLHRLLTQHEAEWKAFVRSLGPDSFVANWASHAQ